MTIITEEQIKKLREAWIAVPKVNSTCIGCSACVAIAPEVFELNEEGVSVVIAADSYNKEDVENSMSACPVDAIVWED
jgi:ferredoxin